jgi:hypothetical protein
MRSGCCLAVVCCLLVAGCAGFGTGGEECRSDWHPIGERDGFLGAPPQLELYAAQCQTSGAKPDATRYEEGWRAGFSRRPLLSW